MKWLTLLLSHLDLIPKVAAAAQTFQQIGHSKESTVQKIVDITKGAAALGEQIPEAHVQAVSKLVDTVVSGVFQTPIPVQSHQSTTGVID